MGCASKSDGKRVFLCAVYRVYYRMWQCMLQSCTVFIELQLYEVRETFARPNLCRLCRCTISIYLLYNFSSLVIWKMLFPYKTLDRCIRFHFFYYYLQKAKAQLYATTHVYATHIYNTRTSHKGTLVHGGLALYFCELRAVWRRGALCFHCEFLCG